MALVKLRAPLKELAGGSEHVLDGGTVGELLRELERAHPGMSGWMFDERGTLRRYLNVFVNGERGREETAVGPEDCVYVVPSIQGG
jgi:molybdopterin synthase sulfur carrier subunit